MHRAAILATALATVFTLPCVAAAQGAGTRLSAAQIKRVLVSKPWNASWGPFSSRIVFQGDGMFNDGLNAPRRWHFAGNHLCIASGAPGRDNCLTFVTADGQLTSFVRLPTGMALSYHGTTP